MKDNQDLVETQSTKLCEIAQKVLGMSGALGNDSENTIYNSWVWRQNPYWEYVIYGKAQNQQIMQVSKYLSNVLGYALTKTKIDEKILEIEPKIRIFFEYACKVSDASVGEIIHSARLVERFVEAALKSESINGQIQPNTGLMSEDSMGTVLLCGVSVTM
ncbi:MAG: hypothetical protein EZS28_052431, partial [Streblomastix strix]